MLVPVSHRALPVYPQPVASMFQAQQLLAKLWKDLLTGAVQIDLARRNEIKARRSRRPDKNATYYLRKRFVTLEYTIRDLLCNVRQLARLLKVRQPTGFIKFLEKQAAIQTPPVRQRNADMLAYVTLRNLNINVLPRAKDFLNNLLANDDVINETSSV